MMPIFQVMMTTTRMLQAEEMLPRKIQMTRQMKIILLLVSLEDQGDQQPQNSGSHSFQFAMRPNLKVYCSNAVASLIELYRLI